MKSDKLHKMSMVILWIILGQAGLFGLAGCKRPTSLNGNSVMGHEPFNNFFVLPQTASSQQGEIQEEKTQLNFWAGESPSYELQARYCDTNSENLICEANVSDDRLVISGLAGRSGEMAEIFFRVQNIKDSSATWFTLVALTENVANAVFIGILPEHVVTDAVVGRTGIVDYPIDSNCFLSRDDYPDLICLKSGGGNGTPVIQNKEIIVPLLPRGVCETQSVPQSQPTSCDLVVDQTLGSDTNLCNSGSSPCETITGALNKSGGGETICIKNGTYNAGETFPLQLPANVTLQGETRAGVLIQNPGGIAVQISSAGGALQRCTITAGNYYAVYVNNASATATLADVTVNSDFRAIMVAAGGYASITNSTINAPNNFSGISVNDANTRLALSGTTITTAGYGIFFFNWNNGTATVNNTVIDAGASGIDLWGASGASGNLVNIINSTITSTSSSTIDQALRLWRGSATISNSNLTATNSYAIGIVSGDITNISGSDLSGDTYALYCNNTNNNVNGGGGNTLVAGGIHANCQISGIFP